MNRIEIDTATKFACCVVSKTAIFYGSSAYLEGV